MEPSFFRPPAPLFYAALSAAIAVYFADCLPSLLAMLAGLNAAVGTLVLLYKTRGILLQRIVLLLFVFDLAALHHYTQHVLSPSRQLALKTQLPTSVEVTGRVLTVPDDSMRFRLLVNDFVPRGLFPPGAELLVHWKGAPPECGDVVRCRALLQHIPPARNPGQFDAAQFFMRQDLWFEAVLTRPLDGAVVEPNAQWRLATWAARCEKIISEQLRRGIESRPQTHALISSMVLGVHSGSLLEARPWFRDTGTLHLFAVSGLNLTMLATFIAVILRIVCIGPRLGAIIALPVLLGYGVATGLGASCVRALVMCLLILGAEWMQRPAVVLNSLGASALILLMYDGNTLFEGGFQLSFGIVLALVVLVRPLSTRLNHAFEPDPLLPKRLWSARQKRALAFAGFVVEALSVSFIAWIAGLPWSVWLFHQITPIGVLVNLVAVPVAFVNLALGFLAVLCAPFGPITPSLNRLNAHVAEWLLDFVKVASEIPGGHQAIANPFSQTPSLVVFDLVKGAAVLLRGKSGCWLLDCGSEPQARAVILPALQRYGVQRLDALILSHGNAAFVGGAVIAQDAFHPRSVVTARVTDRSPTLRHLLEWFTTNHAPLKTFVAGEYIVKSPSDTIEVLYPPNGGLEGNSEDKGLVLRWSTPHWSVLYTADAGFPTERWLLQNARAQLRSDVWIRGNHSREVTGTSAFLQAVNPRLIVVSGSLVGPQRYARESWMEEQRKHGTPVWLLEDCGAVEGWADSSLKFRAVFSGTGFRWP